MSASLHASDRPQRAVTRRRALTGAAVGIAGISGAGALAGCGGSAATEEIATELAAVPTYTPVTGGPTPDLPGDENVQPVYFEAPQEADLFTSVAEAQLPHTTDPVSAFVISYAPPAPSSNSYLEEARKRLDTDLEVQIVSSENFSAKFATVMAGGDIPDMVEFIAFDMPTNAPQLLDAQFTDLSELLGGDAIADYPNLANIPSSSWENCRVNGRIYGTPVHRPPFGSILVTRTDLVEELTGEAPAPSSKDEFTALLDAVTDAKAGRWALCGQTAGDSVDWGYDFMAAMFGVPNGWGLVDGKLVHKFEHEGYLEMASYIKEMHDAGYYHPDTPSMSGSQAKTNIANGSVLMHLDGISALLDTSLPEGTATGAIVPFAADGGAGIIYQGSSLFSFTALKKAEEGRILEQLKVLNYLAAPYGSEEGFFLQYGTKGEHFERAGDGSISVTDAGTAQIGPTSLNRISAPPQILTSAVRIDDQLRRSHAWQEDSAPMLLKSAVAGLYSPTAAKNSSAAGAVMTSLDEYILGRGSLDAVKEATSTWTTQSGDTIRAEYEEQL